MVHIPRHLREQHGWTTAAAQSAVQKFRLRKPIQSSVLTAKKCRDYHKPRKCPVENCSSVVMHMSSHLQSHRIPRASPLYKDMLQKARQIARHSADVSEDDVSEDEHVSGDTQCGSDTYDVTRISLPSVDEGEQQQGDAIVLTETESDLDAEISQMCDENSRLQLEEQLRQFEDWMRSPDGGLKNPKSVKQHASQLRAILISERKANLSALWDNCVLDTFLSYAQSKAFLPATVKAYLNSLRHFYIYVTSTNSLHYSDEEAKNIEQLKQRVAAWTTAFRKDCCKHQQKKMSDDLNRLVTPEQLRQFKSSDIAMCAVKLIGTICTTDHLVSQTDFVTVRDFLIATIAVANANRSGVLANMTLQEFQKARVVDGQNVVSVSDHKTASSYGPAKIVLTRTLHSWMVVYATQIRTQVLTKETPEFFLSWNGDRLSSGQVTRCVQAIWKKAGLPDDVTLNVIRKTAVSSVHSQRPDMTTQLADLMCHRVSTAQKCYRLAEREKTSVEASKQLAELLSEDSPLETSDVEAHTSSAEPVPCTGDNIRSQRMIWNEVQLAELRSLFDEEIKLNAITVNAVRTKIKGNSVLATVDPRKAYDRLRHEASAYRKSGEPDSLSLPQTNETAAERIARFLKRKAPECMNEFEDIDAEADTDSLVGPSSNQTVKDIFTAENVALIVNLCASIIAGGVVSDDRIEAALNKSAAGRQLLSCFTVFQIKNRIKYERRKLQSKVLRKV